MPVKITNFEAENVKRVKAVSMEPSQDGLTIIGGRNGQGKTSVLDAIAWALGGNKKKPTEAKREGSATNPLIKIELSNGIIVERKGANGTLKVTDPDGNKSGQALLDSFIEQLALDLPKFMDASDKEKTETLLTIIGVGDKLDQLDAEHKSLYDERTAVGKMEKRQRGSAEAMPFYGDAPEEPIKAYALMESRDAIIRNNQLNQQMRYKAECDARDAANAKRAYENVQAEAERAAKRAEAAKREWETALEAAATSRDKADGLVDRSTDKFDVLIAEATELNDKFKANQMKREATERADELKAQYDALTASIEDVRRARENLLDGAKLPLEGLNVDGGNLTYNGKRWDCMSGSEQLRVATAIVRAVKPECGFVLVDKLEQMDVQTLNEFGEWAQSEGLQIIGTRVGNGDECSIIIEDGCNA